ncbi:MAG: peptidylprolyl isomerase, partial [Burkholderiaceae bacterium]
MHRLQSLLKEPLVHFLILGALLALIDSHLRPNAATPPSEIVVTEAQVRSLGQNFQRVWMRPPTPEEIEGLIASHIREEVLVREALALGLDRDDAMIRRRLQQKMEFIAEAANIEPSDAELAAYLNQHAADFVVEPRLTLTQIYLDPSRRPASIDAEVGRLLATLNTQRGDTEAAAIGDRLLLLEPRYEGVSKSELERIFGTQFAEQAVEQPLGRWVGPLNSGFGVHLVRLESIEREQRPALEHVRPLVEREWQNRRRQELSQAVFERLQTKYSITV